MNITLTATATLPEQVLRDLADHQGMELLKEIPNPDYALDADGEPVDDTQPETIEVEWSLQEIVDFVMVRVNSQLRDMIKPVIPIDPSIAQQAVDANQGLTDTLMARDARLESLLNVTSDAPSQI